MVPRGFLATQKESLKTFTIFLIFIETQIIVDKKKKTTWDS